MTKSSFLELTMAERAKWLYFNGQMITSIRYYRYKINLYMLGQLYIEVFYNHKQDRVEKIEILDERSTRMNFYADQIKLPGGLF